jgi:predicted deacetylase
MGAKYLIRFDDLCPTMNWEVWAAIESVLLEYDVHPLLAIVPANRDEKLVRSPANPRFWEEVRRWQAKGWTIGLHGYQHRFLTYDRGIVGLHRRSEFAGVERSKQESKLQAAIKIFGAEQIKPQVWIAPAHSFDWTTLEILQSLGIFIINDGFTLAPHQDERGMMWIPQQLWKFRWRPFGVWTVCYHHNHWTNKESTRFREDVSRYRQQISTLSDVLSVYQKRQRGWLDDFYGNTHRAVLTLRN